MAYASPEDDERVRQHLWWSVEHEDGRIYAHTEINGRQVQLHRFILSAPDGVLVDHEDGDGLNCRRSNIRITDSSGNAMNRHTPRTNTSGFKGVSRHNSKWIAQIKMAGKSRIVGRFDSREEAARAYDDAARQQFGSFARLNFPEKGEQNASRS